jgi:cell division protein FtsQ
MRRPTPLPAPPRVERPPRPEPGSAPEPVEAASAPADTAPAPETRDEDTAPIIPLTPGPDDADAPDAPVPLEGRIGVRDVWKAARARRRALRAEVRRFTAHQRHRRIAWLSVLSAFVLLVAGSFGAAYSPLFAVRHIQVVGTKTLDDAAVVKALSGQLGTPLPLVDDAAVKAALVTFPLVQTYSLQANPPHELIVRIVERTPVGVVKSAAGYTLVDAAGVALSTTSTAPKGQPQLNISGTHSEAFRSAGQVIRSLPAKIRKKVTAVSATTPDDVTLTLGKTGTKVVWGSADDSARKGVVLQTLMKRKPPAKVSSYDVSSPDAVLVR